MATGTPSVKAKRAAAQFAWTEPLRPLRKRYRRLSAAAYRLGAIALGGSVLLSMARLRAGFTAGWIATILAIVAAGVAGLLLGRRAAAEVHRLDDEIARLEQEAERQLP